MKKISLLLGLLSLLFLSACASQSCVEDNFCSVDEKIRGNCADCQPDFAVDAQDAQIYYNTEANLVDAWVCVDNKNGEYTDQVEIGWALSSSKEYRGEYEQQSVYFDSSDVRGNFDINANKGNINSYLNVQLPTDGDQKQCFAKTFYDVAPSSYYFL
jgi:hypothetical protein